MPECGWHIHPETGYRRDREHCRYLASDERYAISTRRHHLTNLFGAIVFIARLAHLAVQACLDLCTHPDTISNLDSRHLVAHFDYLANNFMANAKRKMWFPPAAGDCVDVGAADSTCLDLNVDIIFFKGLWFELGRAHVVSVGMIDHGTGYQPLVS